jgi:hypothetical protein
MNAVADREWEDLGLVWRTVADTGAERWVRELVTRQTRAYRVMFAAEVLITVVVLAAVAWTVAVERTVAAFGLGIAAVAHSAIIWAFSLWNRAGVWRPLGESTRDYLAVARERCWRERRGSAFVIGLLLVEGALVMAWLLSAESVVAPVRRSGWWIPPGAVFVGAFVWAVWVRRRAEAKLVRLGAAERSLGFAGSVP